MITRDDLSPARTTHKLSVCLCYLFPCLQEAAMTNDTCRPRAQWHGVWGTSLISSPLHLPQSKWRLVLAARKTWQEIALDRRDSADYNPGNDCTLTAEPSQSCKHLVDQTHPPRIKWVQDNKTCATYFIYVFVLMLRCHTGVWRSLTSDVCCVQFANLFPLVKSVVYFCLSYSLSTDGRLVLGLVDVLQEIILY